MADKTDFRDIQYAFARHIRDPENNPAPVDAEDRRLAIYRDLFQVAETGVVECRVHRLGLRGD